MNLTAPVSATCYCKIKCLLTLELQVRNISFITKLCKVAMNLSFHVLLLKSVMPRLYFKLCFVWNFLRNAIKIPIFWYVNLNKIFCYKKLFKFVHLCNRLSFSFVSLNNCPFRVLLTLLALIVTLTVLKTYTGWQQLVTGEPQLMMSTVQHMVQWYVCDVLLSARNLKVPQYADDMLPHLDCESCSTCIRRFMIKMMPFTL